MELKDCRVLVSSTSYGKNDPWLKTDLEKMVGEVIYNPYGKPLTSEQVRELLPGIDGFIAGLDCIDGNALEKADKLKDDYLAGAGLDALSKEPPEPGTPLLALSNVVSTPHLGSQSDGAVRRMGVMAFEDCIAVLKGLSPSHPVNI